MRLHHAVTVCISQENAERFYEGILGLKKTKTSELNEDLSKALFGVARECRIVLYENEDFAIEVFMEGLIQAKANPFEHICLEVENREGFLKKCQTSGLSVKRIPKGDSLLVFIEDYDGNLFEIKELINNPKF